MAQAAMMTMAEYEAERVYIAEHMPIQIWFNTSTPSDEWLRREIRGQSPERPALQSVIVQGTREADRVVNAMANLKHRRHLPYGGSTTLRVKPR